MATMMAGGLEATACAGLEAATFPKRRAWTIAKGVVARMHTIAFGPQKERHEQVC